MSEILYDCSNKRKQYRLTSPVKVIIEGQEYRTIDWSVSSVKIANYSGRLEKNEETAAEIEINFQGFTVRFSQKIKVLRLDPLQGSLIAEFIDSSTRNREILSYFSRGLITGEFQAFEDIIKHVDIPITDEYVNDCFQEVSDNPSVLKRGTLFLAYILLGIMVLVYAYNLIYSKGYLMQVDSGVVTSRTEVLLSPARGIISEVYAQGGEKIEKGQQLFRVISPELEREIEDKKIEVLKNQALLKEKENQLLNTAQAEKIDYIQEELDKKTILYNKKLVSKPELDRLKGELLDLKQELAYQKAEKERLEEILDINEKDLAFSEAISDRNTVKAPFRGFLEENLAFEGKYVDEKTPLMIVKPDSDIKFIEAYLDESQPHKLVLNSRVYIKIPLYNLEVEGILTEMHKRDRLIKAVIKPDNTDLLEDVKLGTPAKISFVKNRFLGVRGK